MSFSVLAEIESCAFRWGLTRGQYDGLWSGRGYPSKPNAVSIVGQVIHRVKGLETRAAASATLAAGALLTVGFWANVQIYPQFLQRWTEYNLYPDAALKWLVALDLPGDRILNYYNWGGFIMLHEPQFKLFIDGRANTVYDEKIYNDYLHLLRGSPGFHGRVRKYNTVAALLPAGGLPAKKLMEPPSSWKSIYSDRVATILVPPDSVVLKRPMPDPYKVLEDHQELRLWEANRLKASGDRAGAERSIRKALENNPLLVRGYTALATLRAEEKDFDAVAEIFNEAVAIHPRRVKRLRHREASIYERHGELKRALQAYRVAIPGGPFSNPQSLIRSIAQLEERYLEQTAYEGIEGE